MAVGAVVRCGGPRYILTTGEGDGGWGSVRLNV